MSPLSYISLKFSLLLVYENRHLIQSEMVTKLERTLSTTLQSKTKYKTQSNNRSNNFNNESTRTTTTVERTAAEDLGWGILFVSIKILTED